MDSPTGRYLNTSEAAEYCGLAASTLNKMRVFGGGPVYHKVSARVIYSVDDLDTWMGAHRRTNTSQLPAHAGAA